MARIGTRLLQITIGATDYTATCSSAVITSQKADSDFQTYADAAAGGAREYRLVFTAAQDAATGSLWRQVWDNAGDSVACTLIPYGNATPTASEPHYTFNATITEPEGTILGAEADSSTTAVATFECEWVLDAKPTEVTS